VLKEYLNTARNADGTLMLDVKTDLKARDVTTLTDKQQALVSVREDVESVESPVILWRGGMQEAADVDAGEPPPL